MHVNSEFGNWKHKKCEKTRENEENAGQKTPKGEQRRNCVKKFAEGS